MTRYVARRLLLVLPLLLGITIINYVIYALSPGDPINAMIDPLERRTMTREQFEARRESLGLNKPIPTRYVIWLREVLKGNLGTSIVFTQPVTSVLKRGIGSTIALIALSMIVSTIGGILLGVVSALRPYTRLDYALTAFAFAGTSMPGFFFGLLLIYVFAVQLKILPTGGITEAGRPATLGNRLEHMILPMIALSYETLAGLMRYTRSSMLEVLNREYVTTARAKGLRESVVILRHALRNALLPILTILGLRIPGLFAGALLIETVFNYPGIGLMLVNATRFKDYPVLMAGVLVSAVAVLLSNLLADLSYAIADPRIRYN